MKSLISFNLCDSLTYKRLYEESDKLFGLVPFIPKSGAKFER